MRPSGDESGGRRQLHLLVQQLADADLAKLAVFLRVAKERLQFDWKIVFEGEVHLLMYGQAEPATVFGMLESPVAFRRVLDAGAGQPAEAEALTKPLQYEAVVDALLAVERSYAGTPPLPEVSFPVRKVVAATQAATLRADDRYKLRRWPGAALIQANRDHLRLASFLSTRHVGVDELSKLSNVDRQRCEAFLEVLLAAGILDARASAKASNVPVASAATPARAAPVQRGLLATIRRKLGLNTAP
ncbi:MAG: hypothetical protein ABI671_10485 [Burkholderiales bacterium]